MELRDLVITPFVVILVYAVAYVVRPYVSDANNYRYFFPALTLKIVGAIALGFIYQFYYNGGDTFNYHTHGSRIVWNEFMRDPVRGLTLIFLPHDWHGMSLNYFGTLYITFYRDPASYFVTRTAAFIDLFTFSTYTATATIFAAISFSGAWMMFLAFYRAYPNMMKLLAAAVFFIPSVFFWGSGILKDTLVMAALGASIYLLQSVFLLKTGRPIVNGVLLALCMLVMFITKKYVLLCFMPAAILLVYLRRLFSIRSLALRVLMVPSAALLIVASSYYSLVKIGEGDSKYSIDKLAMTAKNTAYDIGFYTGKDAGSGYSLGPLDGTLLGTLRMAPQAINVSLFRPYLWEVKNPLMLLSALESLFILAMTLFVLFRNPARVLTAFKDPYVMFCIVFSITFAFAVGVSTFNFGTLARYKIPMLPFYIIGLMLIYRSMKMTAPNFEGHRNTFEKWEYN
jgi:hypothetical protein